MEIELTCTQLFDGHRLRGASRVVIRNGLVQLIEPIEGEGMFPLLSPGFVDIQMNGFSSWDVAAVDEPGLHELSNELSRVGTTSWLGTIVTAPLDRLGASIHRLHRIFSVGAVPGFMGLHLEGPFLGNSAGAHNPDWIIPIDNGWLESLPPSVKLITLAPEQSQSAAAISQLTHKGVRVSLGHSQPTKDQFESSIGAGANLITHLFNGMSGVHHRLDGLALFALTNDHVQTGLIADGVHCSSDSVNLAFRAKKPGGVVLVSDSIAWQSAWAAHRRVQIVHGAPRLPNGTLAGSSTPLSGCVRFAVRVAGVPLVSALVAATSSPARAMGWSHVGHLTEGQPADVIALDDELSVLNTWRRLPSVRG